MKRYTKREGNPSILLVLLKIESKGKLNSATNKIQSHTSCKEPPRSFMMSILKKLVFKPALPSFWDRAGS
jgi:hypothetical protein